MAELNAYFSAESCALPQWLGDGRLVFVRTGPDGTAVRALDLESRAETVLFRSDEAVRGLRTEPDGSIFFALDSGGSENAQIWRLAPGEPARALTARADVRHQLGGLMADGRTLAVACNARRRGTFDIVGLDIETGQSRMLVQNDDHYNTPAALSPDGRYLLANKRAGSGDNALWQFDLACQTAVQTPQTPPGTACVSPAWKPDGSGFYLVCDAGADFAYVAYCDAAARRAELVLEFGWDVAGLALSHDGRYLAIDVNEGGYHALRVYDLATRAFAEVPALPRGVIAHQSLTWAPGRHRLAFAFAGTQSHSTQGCWVLDLEAQSLSRVSQGRMAGLTAEDFTEPTAASFASFDGLRVPYFLYAPKGASGPMPVMISIHGGPEGQSKPSARGRELLHYMVSQGIAVVEPNIRGSTGYGKAYAHLDDREKRLDSVRDIACLAEHLIETGVADPARLAVMGGSYGGFMTLNCAARMPGLWCCAVCTVGMFDLVSFLENTADYRRAQRESEYGSLSADRELLRAVSPIAKVDDIRGPLMIIHGQNDPRVPVGQSHQAAEYLSGRGVDVTLIIYPDEGHGLQKTANKLDCYPQVVAFVKRHMKT